MPAPRRGTCATSTRRPWRTRCAAMSAPGSAPCCRSPTFGSTATTRTDAALRSNGNRIVQRAGRLARCFQVDYRRVVQRAALASGTINSGRPGTAAADPNRTCPARADRHWPGARTRRCRSSGHAQTPFPKGVIEIVSAVPNLDVRSPACSSLPCQLQHQPGARGSRGLAQGFEDGHRIRVPSGDRQRTAAPCSSPRPDGHRGSGPLARRRQGGVAGPHPPARGQECSGSWLRSLDRDLSPYTGQRDAGLIQVNAGLSNSGACSTASPMEQRDEPIQPTQPIEPLHALASGDPTIRAGRRPCDDHSHVVSVLSRRRCHSGSRHVH